MKKVLSIVIPTYNRSFSLRYTLLSIFNGFDNFPEEIEVIILDNASPDNTKDIVSEFSENFPITYFCRPENIGMDGNIASCFDTASGKYLWVLGDDEILYQGTIDFVLNFCIQEEFGILYLESNGFKIGQEDLTLQSIISPKLDIQPLNSEDMFRQTNVFLTFISGNIVNKKIIKNVFPQFDASTDMNTFLPQMAWIYSALKAIDKHFYVSNFMVGALNGNTGGYKLIEVFGINLINITKKYFHDSMPQANRIMLNAVMTRLIPGELMRQASALDIGKNKFESENIDEKTLSCFRKGIYYFIFLKPIVLGGIKKRKIYFLLLRIFNKINKKMKYRLL